jgi:hypothetical protein
MKLSMYLDNIFKDIRTLVNSAVIKYEKEARSYETLESTKTADKYILAVTSQDSFSSYTNFNLDILISIGIDEVTAQKYYQDKNLIPLDKRDLIVSKQRQRVISTYIEKNNYYRMLNGLPDYNELQSSFIYIDRDTCNLFNIDPNTPIHLLSNEKITLLTNKGKINELQQLYPTKKYLYYLGSNKISILTARTSKNFAILRMSKEIAEGFYEEFNNIYNQCREYFMSVIYIKEFSKKYDLYDNFIALMIMVMTIQRIIVNTFKYGIKRDFYDLASIKMMFDSYNVPFLEKLPLEYQRMILRNLNNLLRYKSTDKVIYDICSLLNFERIKVYKYYLIKQHKLDINEKPLFLYKEVTDELGNTTLVEDKEKMYEFYFQAVELRERNIALSLSDSSSKIDYNEVTTNDPYWWEDEDLKNLLYDSEFNYVESKYLKMNIMYKMTEMLFEIIYIFRLLLDKKLEIQSIEISIPDYFYNKKINLFNFTVLLCALLSKKNYMTGNILATPSKILSVMGFNFKTDFEAIREYVKNNSDLLDQSILSYIENTTIQKPEDVNNLYVNFKGLYDFLVNKMSYSNNIKEYNAYKKLFTAISVTEETTDLFKKSNGEVATTFLEYLQDKDSDLYYFVNNTDPVDISNILDYLLSVLNENIKSLKYLYALNDSNNILLEAVVKLVTFFKSYTVDLTSMNVLYLMDSRYYNMIKLIGDIKMVNKTIQYNDSANFSYNDLIKIKSNIKIEELLNIGNSKILISKINMKKDNAIFNDKVKSQKELIVNDNINLKYNDILKLSTNMTQKDRISFREKIVLIREP